MRRIAFSWKIVDENDPFFASYSQAILSEGPVTFESAIEKALLVSGLVISTDANETCRDAVADYVSGIELLPWAMELLGRCASVPRAIVSNGPFDMQLSALQKFNLHTLVDEVVISGDPNVGIRKPNPEIFKIACSRLGVEPSNTLMIGDNEAVDVVGARTAGLQAINVAELVGLGSKII